MSDNPNSLTLPPTTPDLATDKKVERRIFPIRLQWAPTEAGPWTFDGAAGTFSTMEQAAAWVDKSGIPGRIYIRTRVQGEGMRVPVREVELVEV